MAKWLTILTILRGFLAQCFLVHRGKRGREAAEKWMTFDDFRFCRSFQAPQPQLRPGCEILRYPGVMKPLVPIFPQWAPRSEAVPLDTFESNPKDQRGDLGMSELE